MWPSSATNLAVRMHAGILFLLNVVLPMNLSPLLPSRLEFPDSRFRVQSLSRASQLRENISVIQVVSILQSNALRLHIREKVKHNRNLPDSFHKAVWPTGIVHWRHIRVVLRHCQLHKNSFKNDSGNEECLSPSSLIHYTVYSHPRRPIRDHAKCPRHGKYITNDSLLDHTCLGGLVSGLDWTWALEHLSLNRGSGRAP